MANRRPLTEGIKPTPADALLEREFVYQGKNAVAAATASTPMATPTTSPNMNRVPLSTRIRSDFAAALKRASLERQLAGLSPNTLQDILEQALEPWLKVNGYLD